MTNLELLLWRKEHNLRQESMCTRLSVSRTTYSNWERGVHPVPAWVEDHLQGLTLGAKAQVRAVPINPRTAPHLYTKTPRGFVRTPEHPGYGDDSGKEYFLPPIKTLD